MLFTIHSIVLMIFLGRRQPLDGAGVLTPPTPLGFTPFMSSKKSTHTHVQNLFVVSAETKTLETNQVFAPVSVPLQTVTTAALRS